MQKLFLFTLLITIIAGIANGFSVKHSTRVAIRQRTLLQLSDSPEFESVSSEQTQAFVSPENGEDSDRKIFDMNKRVRLGRSRDQDGKSNIWSIEPTMEVIDESEGDAGLKKNLLVGGLVIGAAIAVLPLFAAFSKIFPDPTDF